MSKVLHFFKKFNIPLATIILFHVVMNIIWERLNTAPPTWDSAGHLVIGMIFSDNLAGFVHGNVTLMQLIKLSPYYPPFVQFLGALVYIFVARNYEVAILLGTGFLVMAMIYLYKIVMHIFNNERFALLTVFIFSFMPGVWEQSRQFHLDVPLVALLLAALYHLLLSETLENRKHSLLFFLFFSFAQLTKWYGFVYLVVPFIYLVGVRAYTEKNLNSQKRFLNIILGSLIVLSLAFPWYIVNLKSIRDNVLVSATADAGDPLVVWSYESLFHYLKLMTSHQIGFISVILLFISMAYVYKKGEKWGSALMYMVGFPYFVFTVIQNKDIRYILPLTPFFAFYIAYILYQGSERFRDAKVVSYATYLFFIYLFLSLNRFQKLPDNMSFIAKVYAGPGYWQTWVDEPYTYSYNAENWRGDEIVKTIYDYSKDEQGNGKKVVILQISDNRYYSSASFDLYLLQNRFYDMRFKVPFYQFDPFTEEELQEYLSDVSYALIPEDPGPPGLRNIAVLKQLVSYFKNNQSKDYRLVETFNMPDGNKLYLYKRTNFVGFVSPGVRKDSLKVYAANTLLVDKEFLPPQQFNIELYGAMLPEDGSVITIPSDGPAQKRISLEGIDRFKIDLVSDRQNVTELRGWTFIDGSFVRDPGYLQKVSESSNTFYYKNFKITPMVDVAEFDRQSPLRVTYYPSEVIISLDNTLETAFVAYATGDWQWNNVLLSAQNAEIKIPTHDLKQLEVTKDDMQIKDFAPGWGYFVCYEGSAVCFYPPVEEL